jgi:hypothetical protein
MPTHSEQNNQLEKDIKEIAGWRFVKKYNLETKIKSFNDIIFKAAKQERGLTIHTAEHIISLKPFALSVEIDPSSKNQGDIVTGHIIKGWLGKDKSERKTTGTFRSDFYFIDSMEITQD